MCLPCCSYFSLRARLGRSLEAWIEAEPRLFYKQGRYEARDSILAIHDQGANEWSFTGKNISQLPNGFQHLRSLTDLDLSQNELGNVQLIAGLTNMVSLKLSTNRITDVGSFRTLTNLEELRLDGNQLVNFQISGSLPNLKVLILAVNRFGRVPDLSSLIRLETLDLSSNYLQSVGNIPSLTQLKELFLSGNPIEDAEDLSGLVHLEVLHLGSTRTQNIEWIRELANLEELGLSNNYLQNADVSPLRQLTRLKDLDVSNDHLQDVQALSSLTSLQNLTVSRNPDLRELPIGLGNADLLSIDYDETQVPEDRVNAILDACRAKQNANALTRVPSQLNLWCTYGGLPPHSLDHLLALSADEQMMISQWLSRLAKTQDFKYKQQSLAKTVCNILGDVRDNPEEYLDLVGRQALSQPSAFKNTFFAQVSANLECCDDRAAMALNEIYVSWELMRPRKAGELSSQAVRQLLEKAGKTLALRKILSQKIAEREKSTGSPENEGVEIYLYYEIALREKLGLLTAIQSMHYSPVGKRNWIQEDALKQEVEASHLDQVTELPIFEYLIRQDRRAFIEMEGIEQRWQKAIAELGDRPEGSDTDERVLAHQHRQGECMQNRTKELNAFKKDWWKQNQVMATHPE